MPNVSVNVKILERTFKLSISDNEECFLRDAAALIDAQARLFKKQFSQRDNQDILSMVALMQVTELVKLRNSLKYKDDELISKLTEIDSLLDKSLHPTQNSL